MISSLRLRQFKNFRDSMLSLGPLTVIVGANATGKSNLRDAFRFVHGMSRGYAIAEIIGEKYVEGGVLQWKGIRGGTRETVMFGEHAFGMETVLSIANDPKRTGWRGPSKLNLTHEIKVDVGHSVVHAVYESFRSRTRKFFDSNPADDPPAQEDDEHLFPKKKEAPLFYRKPATCFLEELQSMRFLDLSPDAMRMASFPGQTVLGDRGENLSSVLYSICQDSALKDSLKEWIRELTPIDVVDFDFIPDQTGRILVSLVESSGQKTSAFSASDGTLRFLAIIAALMGPDSAQFYFLEEIDNGIHPTRLSLLLQLIEQHTRTGKVQVVATTHSPQLLAMLSPEARENAVLVYRLEHEKEAHLQRIMDIPSVREVLEQQNLSRLHESGWLENVMAYMQPDEVGV